MPQKSKSMREITEEIKIPTEYVEKIYKIIESNMSPYPSIDEFVKSAVEMKLTELRGST